MEATEEMATPDMYADADAAKNTTTPALTGHPRKVSVHT